MRLERTISPATNAVLTELVEQQLYISSGESPLVIANAIKAAVQAVEQDTDRSLINQTWTMTLDAFPSSFWEASIRHFDYTTIFIPKGKVQSITSFTYLDEQGDEQSLVEGTDYTITTFGDEQRIEPIDGYPATLTTKNDVVKLVWVSGYGEADTDIPEWAKMAILLKVKEYYDGTDVEKAYNATILTSKLFFDPDKNDR
jgi:uncharacterized phiE125 gp8 family phage protein